MKKIIGTFKDRISAEFARRNYIHKYFIPDVTKVPYVKKVGNKYQVRRH